MFEDWGRAFNMRSSVVSTSSFELPDWICVFATSTGYTSTDVSSEPTPPAEASMKVRSAALGWPLSGIFVRGAAPPAGAGAGGGGERWGNNGTR